jgi:putative ABC transport system permease protein
MPFPRWKKVLADLWTNKARTLLVALSIVVGVFSVGFVSSAYIMLGEDVPADYLVANPPAAYIYPDAFDAELLFPLRKVPGVAAVEGRASVTAKLVSPSGKTYPIDVSRVPDLDKMQIGKLRLNQGAGTLGPHEVFLERQVAAALGYKIGDPLELTLVDGRTRIVHIAGTVQDVSGNPFGWSQYASAFTDQDTLVWLGGPSVYTQLLVTVSEGGHDEAHVREVANAVAKKIEKSGRRVYATVVSRPGEHPAQKTLNGMLALCGGLGVLAMFLSAFLVINTISALMGQQVRQIGVMRAVGGTIGQVTALYLVLVLTFGLTALLIAIPAAAGGAFWMDRWFCGMMGLNPGPFRIPLPTIVIQVAIGLGIPVCAALLPVLGGARRTVREALSDYGMSAATRLSRFDQLTEKIRFLPRPIMLSIRNTFRRKGRLALTLSTLSLGGAIFIGVFSVWSSMDLALEKTYGYIMADVNVDLTHAYRFEKLQEAVKGVPGVVSLEPWVVNIGQSMKADGKTGDDVQLIAPPSGSHLIKPVVTSGRWLLPGDQNAIVVGNHYLKIRPETKVGDTLTVRIGETDHDFIVVGVFEMAGNMTIPMLFTNGEYLARETNQTGMSGMLRVETDRHDAARQSEVSKALQARFKSLGMDGNYSTGSETMAQDTQAVQILISFLLFMAVLISLVGGLGLMGSMSMNVMERTREIGVMRSIGAVDLNIFQLVVVEGLLIGLVSCGLGALAAIPIIQVLDQAVGVSLLNVPLPFIYSTQGLGLWLIVVVFLSGLASLLPARNAVRLTVHDVLAYE